MHQLLDHAQGGPLLGVLREIEPNARIDESLNMPA